MLANLLREIFDCVMHFNPMICFLLPEMKLIHFETWKSRRLIKNFLLCICSSPDKKTSMAAICATFNLLNKSFIPS